MALVESQSVNLFDYFTTMSTSRWFPFNESGVTNQAGYYARLDRLYVVAQGTGGTPEWIGWVDPLFLSNVSPAASFPVTLSFPTSADDGWSFGEWDRVLQQQRIYTGFEERHPETLVVVDTDPWPKVALSHPDRASTEDGWYSIDPTNQRLYAESLGFCFVPTSAVRYQGVTYANVPIVIDLATGDALPAEIYFDSVPLATAARSSPNAFQQPPPFGETFTLRTVQLIEDDDSSHLRPKGELLLAERSGTSQGGGVRHYYMKRVDWNPTGLVGDPPREHFRERLLSRFEIDLNNAVGAGATNRTWIFHPNTTRFFTISVDPSKPFTDGAAELRIFSTRPALSTITSPAWLRSPQTAATIPFVVECLGSLGEPVGGIEVSFDLKRVSTDDERFTGAGSGTSETLVNGPADSDTVEVVEDPDGAANVLVEGVDFTVNGARTQITGIAPHFASGITYEIRYQHKTVPVTPAHGSLLLPSAQSDANGRAVTRVRYDDDASLEAEWDRLGADTD